MPHVLSHQPNGTEPLEGGSRFQDRRKGPCDGELAGGLLPYDFVAYCSACEMRKVDRPDRNASDWEALAVRCGWKAGIPIPRLPLPNEMQQRLRLDAAFR